MRRYGLGALLVEGSQFAVGVEVVAPETFTGGSLDVGVLIDDLEGCLYDTHAFHAVSIEYNSGSVYHDYLTVKGTVANDFADQDDLRRLVVGIVRQCAPYLSITREDAITVIPPSGRANDPNIASQVTQGNVTCRPPDVIANDFIGRAYCKKVETPGQPKKCDLDDLGFSKWIACNLGISPSSAQTVMIFGGVILIAALFRRR